MKPHIVLKLRQPLADERSIPDWQTFIGDKSLSRTSIAPAIDLVMQQLGLPFWITREYKPAGRTWNDAEIQEGLNRTYRMILQRDYDLPADLVNRLKLVPIVQDAHAADVVESVIPRPEMASEMTVHNRRAADAIYLSYAHAFTKGLPQIKIAVLDTGVHLAHQELRGRVVKSADFVNLEGLDTSQFIGDHTGYDDLPEDEVGHGTHVAGIIAGKGVSMDEGVAPRCSLMAVRVLATMRGPGGLRGAGIIDNINVGIKWAVDNGADIINLSLGIKHVGGGLPHQDVIRYALAKNVTVVAASGNDGTAERYYPGALPGVIAVGAVDQQGQVARFSSYGANITVVAPGHQIYSAFANNTYALASGTSQAAPFVAGAIGLMKSYAQTLGKRVRDDVITHVLRHTSDKVDTRLRHEQAGYGLINLADAFRLLTHMSN